MGIAVLIIFLVAAFITLAVIIYCIHVRRVNENECAQNPPEPPNIVFVEERTHCNAMRVPYPTDSQFQSTISSSNTSYSTYQNQPPYPTSDHLMPQPSVPHNSVRSVLQTQEQPPSYAEAVMFTSNSQAR